MKNLMIYVNPTKSFTNPNAKFWKYETKDLVKVQIENSFRLGWDVGDILLVTNFPYEYRGVKAFEVGDDCYCEISPTASKINTIIRLFEMGVIKDELYWFHDFDAFQLQRFTGKELEIGKDIAMAEYGKTTISSSHDRRLSTGSIFFNNKSRDIFEEIKNRVYGYKCNEEVAFLLVLRRDRIRVKERFQRLNVTYNFAMQKRDLGSNFETAEKPLKVLHFHPTDERAVDSGHTGVEVCIYGMNRLNMVLVPPQLSLIFKQHGVS
jgi:hypothetical protein